MLEKKANTPNIKNFAPHHSMITNSTLSSSRHVPTTKAILYSLNLSITPSYGLTNSIRRIRTKF